MFGTNAAKFPPLPEPWTPSQAQIDSDLRERSMSYALSLNLKTAEALITAAGQIEIYLRGEVKA